MISQETDKSGRNPLHYAAMENNIDQVKEEIAKGADVNFADKQGFTPLHFAAQEGSLEAALLLLDAGADVHATNSHGNDALWIGLLSSSPSPKLLKLLRERGADPYHKNKYDRSVADTVQIMADDERRAVFADLL